MQKTDLKDIQMLESAGNLPQADKYYTGVLQTGCTGI